MTFVFDTLTLKFVTYHKKQSPETFFQGIANCNICEVFYKNLNMPNWLSSTKPMANGAINLRMNV